ncbi:hypothetical protein MAN_03070, partial [Metarhizium hybridum]
METALSRDGIQTLHAGRLEEATDVAGLLYLWFYNAHMLHQTRYFAAKTLALLWPQPRHVSHRRLCGSPGMQSPRLGAAPLWGLARAVGIKHPGLCLRLNDLGQGDVTALAPALSLGAEPEYAAWTVPRPL